MENLSCDQLDHCDNLLGLLVGEGCRPSTVSQLVQAYWQKVTELVHDKKASTLSSMQQVWLTSMPNIHAQAAQISAAREWTLGGV